jgi:hypothetical protein
MASTAAFNEDAPVSNAALLCDELCALWFDFPAAFCLQALVEGAFEEVCHDNPGIANGSCAHNEVTLCRIPSMKPGVNRPGDSRNDSGVRSV